MLPRTPTPTGFAPTLERHLADRGALAATARSLSTHTNTLRQRLDRARERYGLNKPIPALRTDLFVHPRVDDGQMNLF